MIILSPESKSVKLILYSVFSILSDPNGDKQRWIISDGHISTNPNLIFVESECDENKWYFLFQQIIGQQQQCVSEFKLNLGKKKWDDYFWVTLDHV